MLLRQRDISERILATRRSALLRYWPLSERSGTTVTDRSGNAGNGTYTAVTLGQPGIGDGNTAASFNGTASYADVFSADLATNFSTAAGTLAVWAKPSSAGVMGDSVTRRIAIIEVNTTNRIALTKSSSNFLQWTHIAGGTSKSRNKASGSLGGDWFHLAITWSVAADTVQAYYNGVPEGAALTALGTWAGTIDTAVLGSWDLVPTTPWSGFLAHAAVWSAALTAGEIATLGRRV